MSESHTTWKEKSMHKLKNVLEVKYYCLSRDSLVIFTPDAFP